MNSLLIGNTLSLIVEAVGIAVSLYILFVVTYAKQLKTVSGILLIHLASVEFLLCFVTFVCILPSVIENEGWSPTTGDSCAACGLMFTFLRPISIWTVCGLNCDRYYAISAPLHYGTLVSPRKVLLAISLIWLISSLLCLSPLTVTSYVYGINNYYTCLPSFASSSALSLVYTFVYITFVFILPIILIAICNIKIFLIARYHKHRIASAIFEVTLSAQVTITHQRNPFSPVGWANKFKGRSAIATVIQLVGSFLIIYAPYYCTLAWNCINSILLTYHLTENIIKIPSHMSTIVSILLLCSSPVNGIIYGIRSKVLRRSVGNYLRKKITENEVNQEIQARTPSACGSRRTSITPNFLARQYRRPSEISTDTQRSNILGVIKKDNITSKRTGSTPGLRTTEGSYTDLRRTFSFGTTSGNAAEKFSTENGLIAVHDDTHYTNKTLLIKRFRRSERKYGFLNPRHSPRIMITRAYSEENETPERSTAPKPSTSEITLLVENVWKTDSSIFDTGIRDDSSGEDSNQELLKTSNNDKELAKKSGDCNSWPRGENEGAKFTIGSFVLSQHEFQGHENGENLSD